MRAVVADVVRALMSKYKRGMIMPLCKRSTDKVSRDSMYLASGSVTCITKPTSCKLQTFTSTKHGKQYAKHLRCVSSKESFAPKTFVVLLNAEQTMPCEVQTTSLNKPVSIKPPFPIPFFLVHLADESVDVVLTVAKITTLNEVLELAGAEATVGVAKLEGPEEVGGLLEVGPDGVDLVDQIFHADNAVLAEVLLDNGVVGKSGALLVDLAVAALVDELLDGLQVGVTVRDPGLDDLEHLSGGLGDADEDTVVDLEETEELEDLAGLGGHLVDTADADNEDQLGLGVDVGRVLLLGNAVKTDLLALRIAVLLDVLLGTLEDDATLLLVGLCLKMSVDVTKNNVQR
jgi:hypothetical protein